MDYRQKQNLEKALAVREEYRKGKSLRQIAREFGISHNWVWGAVRGQNQSVIHAFRQLTDMLDDRAKAELNDKYLKDILKGYKQVPPRKSQIKSVERLKKADISNFPPEVQKAIEYRRQGLSQREASKKAGIGTSRLKFYENKL